VRPVVRRRSSWVIAGVVVVAVGLAVITVLGGWARTTPDGPKVVAPGTEIEAAPFRVTLDRAEATYRSSGRDAEPGQAFLVVDGMLSLDAKESVGILSDTLVADLPHADEFGVETEDQRPEVWVAADDSFLTGLGPGLTYDVRFTFVVAEADVPDRLTVVVSEHVWRRSSLDDTLGWRDPTAVALVTLDVAPLPDERPEPEGF